MNELLAMAGDATCRLSSVPWTTIWPARELSLLRKIIVFPLLEKTNTKYSYLFTSVAFYTLHLKPLEFNSVDYIGKDN